MRIRVYEISGEFATDADSGQQVYELIYPEVVSGTAVELDFDAVNVFASAFFNFAVGQLLADLPASSLKSLISLENISLDGRNLLNRAIDSANRYYSDHKYREAVDSVMQEYASSL